jgi:hypothetical protein
MDRPGFPRLLIVKIEHANPSYGDSYAVNSANLGPYGDAIETELIPDIEKQFRASARAGRGSATGDQPGDGKSLAVQTFYPDHPIKRVLVFVQIDHGVSAEIDRIGTRDKCSVVMGAHIENDATRDARLSRTHADHRRGGQPVQARPGDSRPLGRAVRCLAGGVFAGGQRWLHPANFR